MVKTKYPAFLFDDSHYGGGLMPTVPAKYSSARGILKELVICVFIVGVLLTMDRCLENLYFYFLFDTGKRILDLFMALYLHSHRAFTVIIPLVFVLWLFRKLFQVRLGVLLPILIVYLLYLGTSFLAEKKFPPRWINMTLYPMLMILFVTIVCSTERSAKRFFRVGCNVYIMLMLLNTVFTLFPQLYHLFTDWEPDYFISADNLTGFPLLFGALLALLDRYFNKNCVRCGIYLVLFFLNQALIHCSSAMIAGAILAVYLLFPRAKALAERKPLSLYVFLSLLLCGFLCFGAWLYFHTAIGFRLMDHMLDVLKSLYIRFIIWNGVLAIVARKPVLGYGLGDQAEFYLRPNTSLTYNAHNAYLQTMYEGGLITTGSAVAVLIFTSGILKKSSDRTLAGLFTAVIFAELIMMQSSITSWFTWYPVFLIAQMGALICTLPRGGETS